MFDKIVSCSISHTNCSVLVKLDANMFNFDLLSLYYAIVFYFCGAMKCYMYNNLFIFLISVIFYKHLGFVNTSTFDGKYCIL